MLGRAIPLSFFLLFLEPCVYGDGSIKEGGVCNEVILILFPFLHSFVSGDDAEQFGDIFEMFCFCVGVVFLFGLFVEMEGGEIVGMGGGGVGTGFLVYLLESLLVVVLLLQAD
jgi:hypothetical protein